MAKEAKRKSKRRRPTAAGGAGCGGGGGDDDDDNGDDMGESRGRSCDRSESSGAAMTANRVAMMEEWWRMY